MICVRCGRKELIEQHHIIERCHGGGDESENKEPRCRACHKYEHTWRTVRASLEYERQRGQQNMIRCYEHRLEVLEQLNTPTLIRERGTYLSYWNDILTRSLPHRIPRRATMKVSSLPVSLFPQIIGGSMQIGEWARLGAELALDAIDLSIMFLRNHTPVYSRPGRGEGTLPALAGDAEAHIRGGSLDLPPLWDGDDNHRLCE